MLGYIIVNRSELGLRVYYGGRSGALGCVLGMLFELHALLDVSRFCCLFGDVDVSPVIETSVYKCFFSVFCLQLSIRVVFYFGLVEVHLWSCPDRISKSLRNVEGEQPREASWLPRWRILDIVFAEWRRKRSHALTLKRRTSPCSFSNQIWPRHICV